MKKELLLLATIFVAGSLLISSCGSKEKDSTEQGIDEEREKDEYADVTLLQEAADKKIESFTASLKAALGEAIRDGGPAHAINICSEFAPEIGMSHSKDGWFISRVSEKSRNKDNEADSIQLSILEMFKYPETGPPFVGESRMVNDQKAYFYYKPIYVAELCLKCHGPRDKLASDVVKKLAELYPEDEAVGYAVGDLRGMFVVEVEWPRGKEHAEKMVQGAD